MHPMAPRGGTSHPGLIDSPCGEIDVISKYSRGQFFLKHREVLDKTRHSTREGNRLRQLAILLPPLSRDPGTFTSMAARLPCSAVMTFAVIGPVAKQKS